MCGIAGIFAYHASANPVDRDELHAIRDHMAARGPDGKGEWYSPDNRVGLGHRRLSIIDLSDRAAQPMVSADGQLVVSFNGEIYNYRELKRDLEARGHVFRTESDTEILLHLYAEKGEAMLANLRGMFAFALWDARKQAMLLARDSYGIKPLYYANDGKTFRFASQVKALLAGGQIDTTPEPAGHAGFFLWGSVPEPWTLYRGIRNLTAGHYLWVTGKGAGQPVPFCRIKDILAEAAASPARGSRAEALEVFADAFRDSIRAHRVADVPVGLFLSAGLDSAMIAAIATEHRERPHTLTLAFAEYSGTANDEAPLAEELAARLATRHTTLMVRREDFEEDCEKLLAAMDQPSIDGLNTWFVARAATSQGIKVALSGLGGDELLASYPSFSELPRVTRLAGCCAGRPGFGRRIRKIFAPLAARHTSPKYASLFEYGATLGGAYLLRRGLYLPWELPDVLDPDMARQGLEDLQTVASLDDTAGGFPPGGHCSRGRVSALEMSWYMRNQLLRDTDWASMAQSLEVRVPYLDIPLLKTVAPWLAAHPGISKPEIAAAVAPQLPAVLINKPKTGFVVPVRDWLSSTQVGQNIHGMRTWAHYIYRSSAGKEADAQTAGGFARKRRILLLTTDSYGGHGGIALYNRDIVEALVEMGEVEKVVVVPRNMPLPPEPIPAKVSFLTGALGGKWRYIHAALSSAHRGYDLVICGHINLLPLAVLLNQYLRAPLALMVYGIDVWRPPFGLARQWLKGTDAVLTISAITRDRMNAWARLPLDKYMLLPNAIHLERYGMREKRPDLLERYGLNGSRLIMTLARLPGVERYKGVDEVLELMPALLQAEPKLKYIVAGDGDDLPRLKAKAASLGLSERVIFPGMVQECEKADLFRQADAFVMPSRGEGFGFVFLEALACGVPTVGSKIDGSREALRDGLLGELVDPADRESIKQGVLNALAKPKGIPEGLDYFAWPAFSQRVAAAVRTLLK